MPKSEDLYRGKLGHLLFLSNWGRCGKSASYSRRGFLRLPKSESQRGRQTGLFIIFEYWGSFRKYASEQSLRIPIYAHMSIGHLEESKGLLSNTLCDMAFGNSM